MENLSELKQLACSMVDGLKDRLLEVSHDLHKNPEPAFHEFRSSKLLASIAAGAGLPVSLGAYGLETAFVADFDLRDSGARVAIISEYDALPDVGHACGHNIIATIGLGAALALHAMRQAIPGRIRYLGTPAEERGCGKELLARNGAFDDVDAAMMVHPYHVNAKALRTMYIGEATVTYKGRPGHAVAAPETARNALDAVVLAYQATAALRQHLKKGESISAVIAKGGSVPSVFPSSTSSHYSVRSGTLPDLELLKKRVEGCFLAGARATGCEFEVAWSQADYQPMKINLPLADAFERNAARFRRDFTDFMQLPVVGSDMGNVSQRVPSLHAMIGCAPADVMLHTPEFAACAVSEHGDKAVVEGAKILAMTAVDVLAQPSFCSDVRQAHSADPS